MRTLLPALLLLVAPLSVAATELDYSYVGVGWYGVRGDDFSNERGFGAQASHALGEHWLVGGDYRYNDGRFSDLSSLQLGLGYRVALDERTDGILRVGYVRYEVDGLVERDDAAPFVELSARFDVSPQVDFGFGLRHAEVEDLSDLQLLANLQWKIGNWSLAAEFSASGDGETLLLGPRYNFR